MVVFTTSASMMHGADGGGGDGGGSSTVKLLPSPSPTPSSSTTIAAATSVAGGRFVCLHLGQGWEYRGVDVGAIGQALGLDPASVRLNGYLLGARGPGLVAASVTWRSLLSFFSARGLPTGRGGCGSSGVWPVSDDLAVDGPITVQGRPTSLSRDQKFSGCCFLYDYAKPSHQEDGWMANSKRKLASHHESPPEEEERERNQCVSFAPEDGVSESVLCMAKKLRLDEERRPPLKRTKAELHPAGSAEASACTMPAGLMPNCVMGHRKRQREEELVVPLSCKRTA
ncbi:hypothetical protein Taro_008891 [Colocasia esculenta]|uniref:Uncharacterized protein n=1 Tax=Colocasia esculenta TaxID=4460 RepID=A0A843TYK7_COLES|nr:hypothetical protein [Colocasia esculenta]